MRSPIAKFPRHVAVSICVLLGAVATVAAYLIVGGWVSPADTYRIRAAVPTSATLTAGARVTMAGAQVGRITKVERQGFGTVVEMKLTDDSVTPIPADTRVTLNQRTPVGENYINLTPGRSTEMLPESAVLPIRAADDYVDIDQLLSVLQGRTKQEVRNLIQGAGSALNGEGENLNAVLGKAGRVVQSAGHIFETLHRNKVQTAQLVDRFGRVAAAIGERDEAIRVTANRGLVALRAVASQDEALKDMLEVLPSTLAQVQKTSGKLRQTSEVATPVVTELAGTFKDLRPAIASLEPAASTARRVLAELGRAASPLRTTLREATRLSAPLSRALPELNKTFCQLNPVARFVRPYAKDLLAPLIGLGSASNSYDALGHLIRLQPIMGENSLAGAPASVSAAAQTLLRSGLLVKGSGLSWNPYPGPGKLGLEQAGDSGNIANPRALKESGYKFPRVEADC